jgi:hypothetical protein
MADAAAAVGRKMLAILILVAAAYLLFKVALGFVMGVVWVLVAVVAVVGVVWALRVL